MNPVYVIGAARSCLFLVGRGKNGENNTSLVDSLNPEVFGGQVRDALFESVLINPAIVEIFKLGSLISQKSEKSMFHAPAKTTMRVGGKGCCLSVNASTVEGACATGLIAIEEAVEEIQIGRADFALAGGLEMMSRHPESVIHAVLRSQETGRMMWHLADQKAKSLKITKEEMDLYSFESYDRASCRKDQLFVVPTRLSDGGGPVLTNDEGALKKVRPLEVIRKANPIDGCELITPAHSSKYGDGAAFTLLASQEAVKKFGLKPLARVLAVESWSEGDPENFIVAPNRAIPEAIFKSGLHFNKIGVFLINEAFAPGPISFMKMFDIPRDKVNPEGGAIADSHPFGASGAIRFVMLLDYMKRMNLRYGVFGICAAGGEATACVLESLDN